jgi:hypothetical protein
MTKIKRLGYRVTTATLLVVVSAYLARCGTTGSSGSTEDTSASGAAAGSVGGTMAGSSSSGTMAANFSKPKSKSSWESFLDFVPDALAATACPTLATAAGAGCTQVNATTAAFTYSACSFGSSAATWNGVMQITDSSNVTCGTYPTTTLTRQFVAAAGGAASSVTRTAASGTVATIDDSNANSVNTMGNYQGDTITPVVNGGYGNTVTWSGGVRTAVAVNQRVKTSGFDHTITGSLAINETAGATSRTVTGSVTTYHNLLKVKGTSTFNAVFQNSCCLPTSGTVQTAFAATSQTGVAGNLVAGKTETLTFTGCGTATLVDVTGTTTSVTLAHCL